MLGEPGQTILDVAKKNGIQIPTLCHHPRLPSTGNCRVCVVDVGRKDRLEAACSTPISKGMKVETHNDRVLRARRNILEMLLYNHKTDCLTCEQNGNCELQDLAYDLGIEEDDLTFGREVPDKPADVSSPAIIYDTSKCVLCGRCISACNEVEHNGILGYENRGYETLVISGLGELLVDSGCISCGECVQVCPTGALTEKQSRFRGRWWELKKIHTICPYCGVGCSIEVYIKNNEIVRIRGDENGVENRGSLCVKGRFGYDYVSSQERLTTPLIRRNGRLEEADWDEALDLVASKFMELKERYGRSALAGLASAKCTNEENYLFQKFVRTVLGTNNVDHCARLCHSSTVVGMSRSFGSGAMTNSVREILDADAILVTGSNTTENHPVIGMYIKQAVEDRSAKLIVADPRRIELTDYADVWLRQRGGTDVALFNGIMNVVLNEKLHDEQFIAERCENFEAFRKTVEGYSPEIAEEISGVPAERIREAARIFAEAERASIVFSMGITQHTTGVDNILSLANLAMLTGNIGRKSTGVNPLRGQNNVQGACDVGALSNVYPGYQPVTDPVVRERFEEVWGVKLDEEVGLTVVEMIEAAYQGSLKGMYVMGENPILSDPNLNRVEEALENLEFLVVQDMFLSETAWIADVVLPVASSYEKDGTFTNTGRRIQRVTQALEPVGESRPDWKIICQLSQRMGYEADYLSPAEVMDEIAEVTPIYGGVHYDRLGRDGIQWPCTSREHPGTPYLHRERFSRGKGRFAPVEYRPPAETPDDEYPFLLNTGRVLEHFHTGVMSRRAKVLSDLVPECFIEINPDDAESLAVVEGDLVRVASRRGEIATKARVTERVERGAVFIPFHFKEAAANLLTNDALDPEAKIPEYKVAAVRLSKA